MFISPREGGPNAEDIFALQLQGLSSALKLNDTSSPFTLRAKCLKILLFLSLQSNMQLINDPAVLSKVKARVPLAVSDKRELITLIPFDVEAANLFIIYQYNFENYKTSKMAWWYAVVSNFLCLERTLKKELLSSENAMKLLELFCRAKSMNFDEYPELTERLAEVLRYLSSKAVQCSDESILAKFFEILCSKVLKEEPDRISVSKLVEAGVPDFIKRLGVAIKENLPSLSPSSALFARVYSSNR
jgi:hypothetical protein